MQKRKFDIFYATGAGTEQALASLQKQLREAVEIEKMNFDTMQLAFHHEMRAVSPVANANGQMQMTVVHFAVATVSYIVNVEPAKLSDEGAQAVPLG